MSAAKILIYFITKSPRLSYVLDYIFIQRLHISYELTDNAAQLESTSNFTINYSDQGVDADLRIVPHALLSMTSVVPVELSLNRWKKTFILFYNQPGAIIPFDIFSAIFYILSRYEEYLPYQADVHGRFPASQSIASQYAFLQQPVVDIWLLHFTKLLGINIPVLPQADWAPTIDIDMVWKYKYKNKKQIIGGYAKDLLRLNFKGITERHRVLKGLEIDPFDCFVEIINIFERSVHFFVLTSTLSPYDRNSPPEHPEFILKLKSLSQKNRIGIHPSYYALQNNKLEKERSQLQNIIGVPVTSSRQHYIKLKLPETYHQLIKAGISEDYTMGYAERNGFRAGTSLPFYWYDLSSEEATQLLIHPFVYMDASQLFYHKSNKEDQLAEIERIALEIKKTNGLFTGIWHNYIIGDDLNYPGQFDLFKSSIALLNHLFPKEK